MKKLFSILILIFSLSALVTSCIKRNIKPVNQLSLLPPATQTGARTFGCLVNGQAFVPKNQSIYQGPRIQCNYEFLSGGYYFTVLIANVDSNNNNEAFSILLQTDSLSIQEGQKITLEEYFTSGKASGTYSIGTYPQIPIYHTDNRHNGQLFISHLDLMKQIVSGTFYFTAINSAGDTVKVTDGRFDLVYN